MAPPKTGMMAPCPPFGHSETPKHIAIVGAGPAGCVLALLLSQFSCKIDLFDYRPDPRTNPVSRSRSINLALSTRGLTALHEARVLNDVLKLSVPMHGRCVHSLSGQLQFHPYGQPDQHLLSVSRASLACVLLDACDSRESVNLHFQRKCVDVDLREPSLSIQSVHIDQTNDGDPMRVSADLVVGADGAFSRVRTAMSREDRFNFSQSYIPAVYKELKMSSNAFPHEWLHIWPRKRFMLIALPNSGGSFTCTLFMDKVQFDVLRDPQSVTSFFKTHFPDALDVMPSLVENYFENPTPSLVTIRCAPYNYKGNAIVIGDAAHAVVPFYGQGCNAAFEDCRLLVREIAAQNWNLETALATYSQNRKVHMDALAKLAIDQYEDMSSRSGRWVFVLKRRLEIMANRMFPRFFVPLYSMISFSNIPYADAVKRAKQQEQRIRQFTRIAVYTSISTLAILIVRTLCNE